MNFILTIVPITTCLIVTRSSSSQLWGEEDTGVHTFPWSFKYSSDGRAYRWDGFIGGSQSQTAAPNIPYDINRRSYSLREKSSLANCDLFQNRDTIEDLVKYHSRCAHFSTVFTITPGLQNHSGLFHMSSPSAGFQFSPFSMVLSDGLAYGFNGIHNNIPSSSIINSGKMKTKFSINEHGILASFFRDENSTIILSITKIGHLPYSVGVFRQERDRLKLISSVDSGVINTISPQTGDIIILAQRDCWFHTLDFPSDSSLENLICYLQFPKDSARGMVAMARINVPNGNVSIEPKELEEKNYFDFSYKAVKLRSFPKRPPESLEEQHNAPRHFVMIPPPLPYVDRQAFIIPYHHQVQIIDSVVHGSGHLQEFKAKTFYNEFVGIYQGTDRLILLDEGRNADHPQCQVNIDDVDESYAPPLDRNTISNQQEFMRLYPLTEHGLVILIHDGQILIKRFGNYPPRFFQASLFRRGNPWYTYVPLEYEENNEIFSAKIQSDDIVIVTSEPVKVNGLTFPSNLSLDEIASIVCHLGPIDLVWASLLG